MAKDKDGRPILTADDWKTGKDRKKEPPVRGDASPEISTWGKIWRTVLFLGWEPFAITMDIENNSASKVWIHRHVN